MNAQILSSSNMKYGLTQLVARKDLLTTLAGFALEACSHPDKNSFFRNPKELSGSSTKFGCVNVVVDAMQVLIKTIFASEFLAAKPCSTNQSTAMVAVLGKATGFPDAAALHPIRSMVCLMEKGNAKILQPIYIYPYLYVAVKIMNHNISKAILWISFATEILAQLCRAVHLHPLHCGSHPYSTGFCTGPQQGYRRCQSCT